MDIFALATWRDWWAFRLPFCALGRASVSSPGADRQPLSPVHLADVRFLKRAQFLRRARGMNAPAIVHLLRSEGLLANQRRQTKSVRSAASPFGLKTGHRFRRSPKRGRFGWLSKRARARPHERVGGHSSPTRELLSHEYSFALRRVGGKPEPRPSERAQDSRGRPRRAHGIARVGRRRDGAAPFSDCSGAGSGDSYAHEGEDSSTFFAATWKSLWKAVNPLYCAKATAFISRATCAIAGRIAASEKYPCCG